MLLSCAAAKQAVERTIGKGSQRIPLGSRRVVAFFLGKAHSARDGAKFNFSSDKAGEDRATEGNINSRETFLDLSDAVVK